MARHSIALTSEEAELRSGIAVGLFGDSESAQENGRRVTKLMHLLLERGAIPEARWEWWRNPSYFHGRIKGSRMGLFERNGTRGDDIYAHGNFLRHLRYLLDGARLPTALIDSFVEKVADCGGVSGSDALDLGQFARQEVRRYGLKSPRRVRGIL